LLAIALLGGACSEQPAAPPTALQQFDGRAMGTTYDIRYFADVDPKGLAELVDAYLQEFDHELSTYRPDSDITRVNAARAGEVVAIPSRLDRVLALGEELRERTGGALDLTVKPLRDLYDRAKQTGEWPDAEAVDEALARIGPERWRRTPDGLVKLVDGVQFDVNSIAKGLGVDEVGALLEQAGVSNYKIEIGGEVVCAGTKPGGQPWTIGVENPDFPGEVSRILEACPLRDQALATSGSYQNFAVRDGVEVHHIVDPRSGRNATHRVVSVAVIAPTCALADGLATALMVTGPEQGAAVIESYRRGPPALDVRALFVVRQDDGSLTEILAHWN